MYNNKGDTGNPEMYCPTSLLVTVRKVLARLPRTRHDNVADPYVHSHHPVWPQSRKILHTAAFYNEQVIDPTGALHII